MPQRVAKLKPDTHSPSRSTHTVRDRSTDFRIDFGLPEGTAVDLSFFDHIFKRVRVAFFGEVHGMPMTREFLTLHMAILRAAGVTHLAIELPPDLKESIDHFLDTGEAEPFLSHFKKDTKKECLSLLPLFKAAHDHSIKIRYFDVATWVRDTSPEGRSSELLNQQMAANIQTVLSEKKCENVIVLGGLVHLEKSNVPARLKNVFGFKSVVFEVPYLHNPGWENKSTAVDALLVKESRNTMAASAARPLVKEKAQEPDQTAAVERLLAKWFPKETSGDSATEQRAAASNPSREKSDAAADILEKWFPEEARVASVTDQIMAHWFPQEPAVSGANELDEIARLVEKLLGGRKEPEAAVVQVHRHASARLRSAA